MKPEGSKAGTIHAGEECLRFQSGLPDYLEGENHPEIEEHAAQCEYCRCLLEDVEIIRKVSSEPVYDDPPATAWASIRSTLITEGIIHPPLNFWDRWLPGRSWGILRYPAPIAAAAAVAIAAVVLLKSPRYVVRSPLQSATYTLHNDAFLQGNTAPQDVASLRQTISELEQSYQANQSSLEPSMRATYAKSLASLNREIQECQVSMKQEPQNRLAVDYLSSAYVQKVQLLQTALEYNLR